jgi:hypothetical protein
MIMVKMKNPNPANHKKVCRRVFSIWELKYKLRYESTFVRAIDSWPID